MTVTHFNRLTAEAWSPKDKATFVELERSGCRCKSVEVMEADGVMIFRHAAGCPYFAENRDRITKVYRA